MKWVLVIGILIQNPDSTLALKDRRESHGWTSYKVCEQAAEKLRQEYKSFDAMFFAGCEAKGGIADINLPQGH